MKKKYTAWVLFYKGEIEPYTLSYSRADAIQELVRAHNAHTWKDYYRWGWRARRVTFEVQK